MSTTVAFTICSINYLAQAITLGDSLKKSNPDIEFRIYLVDRLTTSGVTRELIPYSLVEIEDVPIAGFEDMCVRYNITELNTSVKPYIIDHIFKTEFRVKNIIYFDPDIMVLASLNELIKHLLVYSIVLTPHILTPSDEKSGLPERSFLATGIYNLGFIAVSKCDETGKFLKWWKKRLFTQGYANAQLQLFYDQKWLNLAPVFFEKVYIEKSPGYNMAGWNLHEREVTSKENGKYIINQEHELIFYHFSGVKAKENDVYKHSSISFNDRPDLQEIIENYRKNLIANKNDFYKTIKCHYSSVYKGMTVYYPRYHWITLYRRTRFHIGKYRRILSSTLKF
ncbi:glycosyl transferase [Pontibacter locisalis]|uniref:Glycosyl transferase n=1 Tax=Pontibacter locisalis TaxID=1719035 RepID=A0ABW5IRJ7_9BACT